jgi:hypothetical protein
MRHLLPAIAALLFATSAAAQSAPFCAVDAAGTRCFYYDMESCRRAVGTRGACVVNQNGQSQQQNEAYNPWDAFEQGQRVGRNMRDARNARELAQQAEERSARWSDFCERMQSTDFQLIDALRANMTADEYALASRAIINRATYCRSIAQ